MGLRQQWRDFALIRERPSRCRKYFRHLRIALEARQRDARARARARTRAHARRVVSALASSPSTIAVSWTVPSDGLVNPVKSHRSVRDGVRVKMSGGMPELGSKISLISKADIRYEGRLFTVDPQECTIALANGE